MNDISGFVLLPCAGDQFLSGAFRNDHDRVVSAFEPFEKLWKKGVFTFFQRELFFRDQAEIRVGIRKCRVCGDESGVTSHDMNQSDPVIGALRLVVRNRDDGICGIDRGFESECLVHAGNIVVDGFGNADNADVQIVRLRFHGEIMRGTEGSVPADAEQHVDVHADQRFKHNPCILSAS